MIKLRVARVEEERDLPLYAIGLCAALTFGVAIGWSVAYGIAVSLSRIAPSAQLGATAVPELGANKASMPSATATASEDGTVAGVSTERATKEDTESTTAAPVTPLSRDETLAQLSALIRDRDLAIERIIREIERVKDNSVAAITAFDQSCGNWNDACAETYKATLEANNARYAELEAQLDLVRKSRDQALADREAL